MDVRRRSEAFHWDLEVAQYAPFLGLRQIVQSPNLHPPRADNIGNAPSDQIRPRSILYIADKYPYGGVHQKSF